MAVKASDRSRISCLLIALLILLTCSCQSRAGIEATDAVRLETFLVGVIRFAQRRYQVKDIKVGEVSVLSLFNEVTREDPGWWPGGFLRNEKIHLVLKGGKEWGQLRQILIAHDDAPLDVIMRDEWNPLSRTDPYEYRIRIPVVVEKTPCDLVTRVVYEKVVSKVIKDETDKSFIKEGQTEKHLDISDLVEKLRDDKEIEAYIDDMDPATAPCVKTIRLLKSNREAKTTRFGSGEYTLYDDIQQGLKLIIEVLATDAGWWKSELSLKVTGFTDEVEVQNLSNKQLQIDKTGIDADAWRRINNRFDVYYSGCDKNKVKAQPIYISFDGGTGEHQVKSQIENNCELGAMRAYVALVFLTNALGRVSPEDTYATGGVISGKDVSKNADDPEKRRVHVELIMRAAKQDQ
jgi:flagellar motor protein MotB